MDNWKRGNLGDFITLKRGYDLPAGERHPTGNVPIISSSGVIDCHSEAKVTGPGVVTGRYGSIGAVFYVDTPFWPLNTTLYVQDFKGNESRFIYYFLQTIPFKRFSDKTGVPGVNRNDLHQIKADIPSLQEQRKIAAILSTWDAAISTAEKLVAALQERKWGLMQRLLTGKVRFQDLTYTPWSLVRAGDIFQPFSQRKNDGEELLSVTQDRGVIPRSMLETRVVMPEGATDSYKLVERGDFIISLRSFQGGIEYSEYRGIVSPAYTVLKPKVDIVDGFYKQIFKSDDFIARLGVAIIGIRDGKQINFDDFANIKLPSPSIVEQCRIAQVFATVDEEISLFKRKLELLRRQKQGLMQRLLTGQVRVQVDEEE